MPQSEFAMCHGLGPVIGLSNFVVAVCHCLGQDIGLCHSLYLLCVKSCG